jgi:hypothetical protein
LQGLSQPTISRIVKYISSAICLSLKTWVNFPNENKIPEIKEQFYKIAKFPGVTMVIDCTHIPISSPGGDNAMNYLEIEKIGCQLNFTNDVGTNYNNLQ